jgi:hypothetical protein
MSPCFGQYADWAFTEDLMFHRTWMLRLFAIAISAIAWFATPVQAANDGQDDLDKATQLKIAAETLSDLSEVIRLSENALKAGLDEGAPNLPRVCWRARSSIAPSSFAPRFLTRPRRRPAGRSCVRPRFRILNLLWKSTIHRLIRTT